MGARSARQERTRCARGPWRPTVHDHEAARSRPCACARGRRWSRRAARAARAHLRAGLFHQAVGVGDWTLARQAHRGRESRRSTRARAVRERRDVRHYTSGMSRTAISPDVLASLNDAQREAVLHFEGPILVLAGAGSGKTRVLTTRIARLIEHHGVDPRHILVVTFTNKAAGEMRERVSRALGTEPEGMWAGTFHAIGARLLRREAPLVGRTASFTIYDEDDSLALVRRVMEQARISTKDWAPKALRAEISDAKNGLVTPEDYAKRAVHPVERAAAVVYPLFERALREANAADFDDLLVLPVRLLEQHPDRLAEYRRRFQFILVDKYQDTNRAQYRFIALLGGEHGNVLVVGDDDQSIYGWRGADIRNILDFEKDFPAARVVRLEENYRSTPQVLELANVVISANTSRRGKTLRAT